MHTARHGWKTNIESIGNPRYIFTGGPGSGKTATLKLLEACGFVCMPDVARQLIRERMSRGLSPRPLPADFAAQILEASIAHYDACPVDIEPVFFDRGIADALAMMVEVGNISRAEAMRALELRPYNHRVFFFPVWSSIYQNDPERDQPFHEAVNVSARVRAWYEDCGAELLEMPFADPEQRANLVLESIR